MPGATEPVAGLSLRRMTPDGTDWPAVLALVQKAFDYMNGIVDPPSSANRLTVESLRAKSANEHACGIFDDAAIVACLFCEPRADCLYAGKLAVLPGSQGKGLGKWLMTEAERLAPGLGLGAIELQCRVELIANHRFFERLGYRRTGETAHAGYCRPTSITMRKVIASA